MEEWCDCSHTYEAVAEMRVEEERGKVGYSLASSLEAVFFFLVGRG